MTQDSRRSPEAKYAVTSGVWRLQLATWRCPYCNQNATLINDNLSSEVHRFNNKNKDGNSAIVTEVIVCPNEACKEYVIQAGLYPYYPALNDTGNVPRQIWRLKPQSSAKPIPAYVPKAIREDYEEACLIVELSPKASATLSRRCLQGMIRDFHGIVKSRLFDEIRALQGHVDQQTWNAIDALRNIGNIGAHMEADINTIVDVDPDEATLLIQLIENLIEEWYVRRYERDQRMNAIIAAAQAKKAQKAQPVAPPNNPAGGKTP